MDFEFLQIFHKLVESFFFAPKIRKPDFIERVFGSWFVAVLSAKSKT